jgi:Transglycosylase
MTKLFILTVLSGIFDKSYRLRRLKQNCADRVYLRYKFKVDFQKIHFRSYRSFEIKNISLEKQGIIITIDRAAIDINYKEVVEFRSLLKSIRVKFSTVSVTNKQNGAWRETKTNSAITINEVIQRLEKNLYAVYHRIAHLFPRYLPKEVVAEKINVNVNTYKFFDAIQSLSISKNSFSCEIILSFNGRDTQFHAIGITDKAEQSFLLNLTPLTHHTQSCLHFSFEQISVRIAEKEVTKGGENTINLNLILEGFRINYKAICTDPLVLKKISFESNICLSNRSFIIMDDSSGTIENIPFSFYFRHNANEDNLIQLIILIDIESDDLVNALPIMSVPLIKKLPVDGNLLVKFCLVFDTENPYEHSFNIFIEENGLLISESNRCDLAYLNHSFLHTIYKDNVPIRTISLDKSAITFCKLESIHPTLLDVITYSEDPNFFDHPGIDTFFIGYAIVTNIATKKLKRGGSTITMQLARNLFLNHDKNLVRKLEEVIIALLLENIYKIPKKRLLEIYLNIIEFGPNIYGINEAARFYFNKQASKLTLIEIIILTYIIPRPIHFHDALKNKTNQLSTNLKRHILFISKGLRAKESILPNQLSEIEYLVHSSNSIFDHFELNDVH